MTETFAEFHRRFLESLPANDRPGWMKTETARELRKHRELCHGPHNVLLLVDGSFRPYCAGDINEQRMERHRGRARFISDGAEGLWAFRHNDGIWARVTVAGLIANLRDWRLSGEEIFRLRTDWRKNALSLSDLLKSAAG